MAHIPIKLYSNLPPHDGFVCKNGVIAFPQEMDNQLFIAWRQVAGSSSADYIGRTTWDSYNAYMEYVDDYSSYLTLNFSSYDFFVKGTIGVYVWVANISAYYGYFHLQSRINNDGLNFSGYRDDMGYPFVHEYNYDKQKTFDKWTQITDLISLYQQTESSYTYIDRRHVIYFLPDCSITYKRK